jgi:hypothetical protein
MVGKGMQLAINQFLESATIMARHLEKYLSCQQMALLTAVVGNKEQYSHNQKKG